MQDELLFTNIGKDDITWRILKDSKTGEIYLETITQVLSDAFEIRDKNGKVLSKAEKKEFYEKKYGTCNVSYIQKFSKKEMIEAILTADPKTGRLRVPINQEV